MTPPRRKFAASLAAVATLGFFILAPHAARSAAPLHLPLGGAPPAVANEADLTGFLDELEAQELMVYEAQALEGYFQWRGDEPDYVTPFSRFGNDLRNRRDYAAVIEAWRGKVADTTLARRLEIQHKQFLQSRADPADVLRLSDVGSALQDSVNAFRFHIGGESKTLTGLSEILTNEKDRAKRQEAFLAMPQAAQAHTPAILECMRLLDRTGREEGFANGADAGLVQSSLTREQVLHDLNAFEAATRPTMQAMVARAHADLGVDRTEPWDIDYWLHLQELSGGNDAWPREPGLQRLNALMKDLGFNADSLPIDARVWDVPTGGITFPIRPPFESRLLTNPFTGSDFYETLFHEYGHCLNAVLTDGKLAPAFLLGDETPLSEGVAECLGHFAYDAHWLERTAGVTPQRAQDLERVGKMQLLLWLRRSICCNAYFELTAYGNLGMNLDSLYAATYRRFVCVDLPAGHYFGYRDMFGTGPFYFQSYLYANMIATQLRDAMRAQFGVSDLSREKRVAGWLTAYFFAPGGSVAWPEKIRRATGKPLGTESLARYLAGAMPAAGPPHGGSPGARGGSGR